MNFGCNNDALGVFHKTTIASELEERDIDKARNIGFRVIGAYD